MSKAIGSSISWISMKDRRPDDGQLCLTEMKHGFISGEYSAKDDSFSGYYWNYLEWDAWRWVPLEDISNE